MTVGIVIDVSGKVVVSSGTEASAALLDRAAGSIASGEATGMLLNGADNIAPARVGRTRLQCAV